MPASRGKSVQSLKAEETPGYSFLERCSLFLKSWVTLNHLQMWIQKQLEGSQVEQWHQADVSRESKQGFPTALHHTSESSVVPSRTPLKRYQASPLELFSATLYSCGDSSLGELQPAESLISCAWAQKLLFDVSFSKISSFLEKKKYLYGADLWAQVLKPVLGAEKNTRMVLPWYEDVGCHRQTSQFCLYHNVKDIT